MSMRNNPTDNIENGNTILIVEDNVLLSDAIEMMIKLLPVKESLKKIEIRKATDYESGVVNILEIAKRGCLDTVILDINLGKLDKNEKKTGLELGVLIRKHTPKTKIIVFTSHCDELRINTILKSIKPEGFLIKDGNTDHNKFQEIVLNVIGGKIYYSDAVVEVMHKKTQNK
ncbi:DNA-binding response regulator [Aureibaculum marinum]|uniref:DNA-binding response regulator n=1 Tax=Aureibaculum marinum TaxID=2487930 RepID=A0A3N4NLS4_9FLAO|nr:response regulator [Aureibaculum marinum]RPD96485.1 DNA-binding response regulator [Aureibaculum marinum]